MEKLDDVISLCYCGNDKMFQGILLSSLSAAYTVSRPLRVYILTADLTEGKKKHYTSLSQKEASFIERALQRHNPDNKVIRIDCKDVFLRDFRHCINFRSVYTPYAFMRLVLDDLPDMPKRMLYLDADTIVMKSLEPLFDFPMERFDIAFVKDAVGCHYFGNRYGNSGVLLINLEKVKEDGAFKRVRSYVRHIRLFMPDQTAMNRVLRKTKFILPDKYNEQLDTKEDTVIRHYCKRLYWFPIVHTLSIKPWDVANLRRHFGADVHKALLNEYQTLKEEGAKEGFSL